MSFTHNIVRQWQRGQDSITQKESPSADAELNLDIEVSDDSTVESLATINASLIKSLFMCCDQDVEVRTNSSGSPDDTIMVKANCPVMWTPDSGLNCPITSNVTSFFILNSSGHNATWQLRCLVDSTD